MTQRKPWGGRFTQATDPAVERFTASVHFDRALARYDLRGSIAHAQMLGKTPPLWSAGSRNSRRTSKEADWSSTRRSKTST